MKQKSLLKLVLLLQTIILAYLIAGAFFVRSHLLIVQADLDKIISNLTISFQQISAILPGLNSVIDISLSLEDSLAILRSIKIGLQVLLTTVGG